VTTEPFDNLRLATQISGEKQLSLVEQFYTEAKVVRLTGAKGAIEWVKVNQPEQQPDGSVRFINDITDSAADFQVSEADYAGTMRQVMFDALNQLATRLPPDIALRLMTIAMDFSDLPNKDEVAAQIRAVTGERDPNKELTPEEMQQQEQQLQQQAEAMQMQREQAMAVLAEQQAKVREINARAAKLEAEALAGMQGADGAQQQAAMQGAIDQVRQQASQEIDRLAESLRKAQSELANRTMQIRTDADTKLEAARIDADSRARVAEIQAASDKAIGRMEQRLDQINQAMSAAVEKASAIAAEALKEAKQAPPQAPAQAPAPAPAPAPAKDQPPININVTVDAKPATSKTVKLKTDKDGNIIGADVNEAQANAAGKAKKGTP